MWTVLVLFLLAMALILTEFLVPGAILGIIGGALLLVSMGYGIYKFPDYALFIVLGESIGFFVCIGFGFYLITSTRFRKLIVLDDRQDKSEGYFSPSEDPGLVGTLAEAITPLRPAGSIEYNGRKIDAVSSGELIEKGMTVQVIEVEGHRVVVERAATDAEVAGGE